VPRPISARLLSANSTTGLHGLRAADRRERARETPQRFGSAMVRGEKCRCDGEGATPFNPFALVNAVPHDL
jgi:hypothetical protein